MDRSRSREARRYPARILLVQADKLVCATHPSEQLGEVRIPREEILALETGQFLLSVWIRVFTAHNSYWWPFAAHNTDVVESFLGRLKRFLFSDAPLPGFEETATFGGPLSFKLANTESAELLPGEEILLRFWFEERGAERPMRRRKLLSEQAQDYLAVTNRRLLWITDRLNGRAQPYGAIRRSFPLARLAYVDFIPGTEESVCQISLTRAVGWSILIPVQHEENARGFVAEAQRLLWSCAA
jgi:hypothetical protein